MSTDSVRAGVFDNVIAHVSGEVCVDPPIDPAHGAHWAHAPPAGWRRRRSRAAGLWIHLGPRSGILIPAP